MERVQEAIRGTRLIKAAAVVMLGAGVLGGCASMKPTMETRGSYVIYDIKAGEGVSPGKISEAVKGALQKNMSSVQIKNSIPPYPLPEKPGRFQMVNPYKGTGMEAMIARSGQSFETPTCSDAILTAYSADTGMAKYGETTSFFLCVLPYQGGYHMDIYVSFTKKTGSFSVDTMAAGLVSSMTGDSSQFIPRTIKSVVDAVAATGAAPVLIEQFP